MDNPVEYKVVFRNADHALTAKGIVNALEEWSGSQLAVTVTHTERADGGAGPAVKES